MFEELDDELQQMDEREQDAPELAAAVHLDDPISVLQLQELSLVHPDTVMNTALDILNEKNIGCLLVEENDQLVGIFTERDVLRRVVNRGLDYTKALVGEYMTPKPDTLRMGDSVAHALNHMYDRGYRHIPIIDKNNKALGFISIRDIVNHLATFYRKEILNVPPKPVRTMSDREGG